MKLHPDVNNDVNNAMDPRVACECVHTVDERGPGDALRGGSGVGEEEHGGERARDHHRCHGGGALWGF